MARTPRSSEPPRGPDVAVPRGSAPWVEGSRVVLVDTPAGRARALVGPALVRPAGGGGSPGVVVLGHGAGGGLDSPDLAAARRGASAAGWTVVGIEQPWRVAGRRVAAPPPRLDEAWLAVLDALRADGTLGPGVPLVVGGRSAGARVACRTASALGAAAVLCLAFPLAPPGRPERSRLGELVLGAAQGRPVVVVQGHRDPFGGAADLAARVAADPALATVRVVGVEGDHALRRAGDVVAATAADVLAPAVAGRGPEQEWAPGPSR